MVSPFFIRFLFSVSSFKFYSFALALSRLGSRIFESRALQIVFNFNLNNGSKTSLNFAIARMKLLQNKRDMQLKHMKKEIAQFLQAGQEPIARIRVLSLFFNIL